MLLYFAYTVYKMLVVKKWLKTVSYDSLQPHPNYLHSSSQKLDAIAKLKAEQKSGKTLEINQLSKIATEDKLLKELEDLSLWSPPCITK